MFREDIEVFQGIWKERIGGNEGERNFKFAEAFGHHALPGAVEWGGARGVLDFFYGEDHVVARELFSVVPEDVLFEAHAEDATRMFGVGFALFSKIGNVRKHEPHKILVRFALGDYRVQ